MRGVRGVPKALVDLAAARDLVKGNKISMCFSSTALGGGFLIRGIGPRACESWMADEPILHGVEDSLGVSSTFLLRG